MIAVIDYGMGNLRSVQKALQRVGGQDVRLVTTGAEVLAADKVVLPGVAAFGDAMAQLNRQGLVEPIRKAVAAGKPYLGFCLGLQLLFETGYEDGRFEGLGILKGEVVRLNFTPEMVAAQRLRVPHMGWNRVHWLRQGPMTAGIEDGSHLYFAHSYHVVPADAAISAGVTTYGYQFTSVVWRDNVFATQFHPEKSQQVGLRLLENFVKLR
jgi:glutamine amidotransferase